MTKDEIFEGKGTPLCGFQEPALSPCGKYRLEVTKYETKPGCWEYTRGRVYKEVTRVLIAEVRRNFYTFPYSWIPQHANGHAYLICGENYQGQTVIELDTGKRVDYLPEAARSGFGFCWADHEASPDGTLLGVNGCYWGAPYEGVVYDFSEPLNPPWPELIRSDDAVIGWEGDKCKLGLYREIVNVPGHPLDGKLDSEMTSEEMEVIEKLALEHGKTEDDMYARKATYTLWSQPPPLEVAWKFIVDLAEWVKSKKKPVIIVDDRKQVEVLIKRLSLKDRETLLSDPKVMELLLWMETVPDRLDD